jgi:hypothetical protein
VVDAHLAEGQILYEEIVLNKGKYPNFEKDIKCQQFKASIDKI